MVRVKFGKGKQREFIDEILVNSGSPSLKELINRGINVSHSSLKNYHSERRLMTEELFDLLCKFSDLNKNKFSVEKVSNYWGQIKGGQAFRKKFK